MKMQDIRSLAKKVGATVKPGMSKVEAIRSIQRVEGHFDCFGTASDGYCDQYQCIFREDCLPVSQGKKA